MTIPEDTKMLFLSRDKTGEKSHDGIKTNQYYEVLEEGPDWYRIKVNGKSRHVDKRYFSTKGTVALVEDDDLFSY